MKRQEEHDPRRAPYRPNSGNLFAEDPVLLFGARFAFGVFIALTLLQAVLAIRSAPGEDCVRSHSVNDMVAVPGPQGTVIPLATTRRVCDEHAPAEVPPPKP